jgi:hypothetical protein
MNDAEILKNIDQKLLALIALLVDQRERGGAPMDKGSVKTELLLKEAGLSVNEIAKVLNKNVAAVHKAVQRAKK